MSEILWAEQQKKIDHVIGEKKARSPWEGINGDMIHDSWGYSANMFANKNQRSERGEKEYEYNMIARFISSNTESLEKHQRARFHPARKVIGWRNIGHNPFGLTQHPIFPIQWR